MNKKIRIILFTTLFSFCLGSLYSCRKTNSEPNYISTTRSSKVDEPFATSQGLKRFLDAQTEEVLQNVEKELTAGNKTTHWIWFIFPQLKDLGSSSNATFYGIESLEEAEKYLKHSLLHERLLNHASLVLIHLGKKSLEEILGPTDKKKFISSMTLFLIAAYKNQDKEAVKLFANNLNAFNGGIPDFKTLNILGVTKDEFDSIMQEAKSYP
jgi:uncharacterized protein (DUF1810 family)